MKKCVVCLEGGTPGTLLCGSCGQTYGRQGHRDGTVAEVIEWAAKRARYYERKRWVRKVAEEMTP